MNLPASGGGDVLGMGIDLVEVDRIEHACKRHGDRFLKRVFTGEERAYCLGMKNPWPHFAARFAAKEAAAKAFGTGIGGEFGWTSLGVYKGSREEPLARMDQAGQLLLDKMDATDVLISLSHTTSLAMAAALIVRKRSAKSG